MGSKTKSGRRIVRTKRQTKAQREEAAKAALRQRIDDLWIAITGDVWDGEDSGGPWPEQFVDFVQILKRVFCVRRDEDEGIDGNEYLWELWQLKNYHNPEAATEYLFSRDVRA